MPERDLLGALDDLAAAIDWPDESIDVTARAIERVRVARPRRRWRFRLAGAIVVGGLVAGPAVADRLGVDGVRIRLTGDLPAGLDAGLQLGRVVPASELRGVRVPRGVGPPAAAFAGEPPGGVSLVWAPSPRLPEVLDTGVGLLVTAFPGRVEPELVEKRVFEGGTFEPVTVDGAPAWWIGGTHGLLYVGDDGDVREDTLRLAGSALVWSRDGTTYRLESALSRADAVRLAESMT